MDSTIARILLIRHARSIANVDPTVYLRMPDHMIPLADPHEDEDARAAGDAIAALAIDPASVCSWSSSFLRCRQTERIEHLEQPPAADPVAVIAPGEVHHVGLRSAGRQFRPEPLAEREMLQVHAEIDQAEDQKPRR